MTRRTRKTAVKRKVVKPRRAARETKTVGLQVAIERTHQDALSWGAYFELEPTKNFVKSHVLVPVAYLLEVSWVGTRLRPQPGMDPIIRGNTRVLQFPIMEPGQPGSRVHVFLRYNTTTFFTLEVTGKAWRLHDMQPQGTRRKRVEHQPGSYPYP